MPQDIHVTPKYYYYFFNFSKNYYYYFSPPPKKIDYNRKKNPLDLSLLQNGLIYPSN